VSFIDTGINSICYSGYFDFYNVHNEALYKSMFIFIEHMVQNGCF